MKETNQLFTLGEFLKAHIEYLSLIAVFLPLSQFFVDLSKENPDMVLLPVLVILIFFLFAGLSIFVFFKSIKTVKRIDKLYKITKYPIIGTNFDQIVIMLFGLLLIAIAIVYGIYIHSLYPNVFYWCAFTLGFFVIGFIFAGTEQLIEEKVKLLNSPLLIIISIIILSGIIFFFIFLFFKVLELFNPYAFYAVLIISYPIFIIAIIIQKCLLKNNRI